MSDAVHTFLSIDLLPLLAATLAAFSCGLLGNFLVLRRLSLMGDAISHAVLPGLVIAFLLFGTRASLAMFVGAAVAGVATVALVELIRRFGRVEPGAAMGVVFSVLFALGVLLLEQAAARNVDLDADCVLHGQLETLFWVAPREWSALFSLDWLREVPRQVVTLAIVAAVSLAFVAALFKELRIAAFDPGLATTQGIPAGAVNGLLMVLVAAATVASFEAVGSILVVAMLVCPAATARMLTDRLLPQVVVSAIVAAATAILGYGAASLLPHWLGLAGSVNAAGAMTVTAGVLLTIAVIAAPRHGVLARAVRRRRLATQVQVEDLLGALFRKAESGAAGTTVPTATPHRASLHAARIARRRGLVSGDGPTLDLTPAGRRVAAGLIRRHRLWEAFLVDEAGWRSDHVHEAAETLEHLRDVRRQPLVPGIAPDRDPHGRSIPGGADPARPRSEDSA
ncbi:MAG: metal ABC transporter permease [Phycisphaerales bacterium]|nr:metal ABC transporter permease [Phycisphaerales bacterium]